MVQQIAPPPNAVITIQPLTTAVGSQESAAPVLQGMPNGTLIEGFVVNRDTLQNPILRTALGDILVKSDIFLKTGSEVILRVDTQVDSRARIISIDGLTPQDYVNKATTLPATSDEILPSSLLSNTQAIPANLQGNTAQAPLVLSALLLSPNVVMMEGLPPQVAQAWAQLVAGLQKDSALLFKILKTELPLPAAPATQTAAPVIPNAVPQMTDRPPLVVPQNLTAAPATTAPTTAPAIPTPPSPTVPTSAPAIVNTSPPPQPQPSASPLPPSAAAPPLPADPARIAPPANHAPQAAPVVVQASAQALTVTANVIGHEYDGGNIVQTPLGTFKLLSAQPLPTGSKLTIEVMPETRPSLPTGSPTALLPTDLDELTLLARDWRSLRESVATIAAQDPQMAGQIIANILPKAHGKLTSEMLFLFAAIKSGTPDQWFGKRAIEILELRSPEMLKRLRTDFTQLQQAFTDGLPQWNSLIMPFYNDSQLQHIRMFFRHDEDSDSKGKGADGQRFVIEVDLSHLGDMQFDGFIKQSSKGKQFDLIVRTAKYLPTEVEQHIRGIFEQSLQITGYKGYMHFQQGIQHFVRPLEMVKEALKAEGSAIIA